MQVTARQCVITPEFARELLEKNTRNRPVSPIWVAELAKRMRRGDWKFNGDSIRVNGDILIDGQHRLKAVIESGVSITVFIIDGLESSVFDTIDTGRKRTGSDTLAVMGEKNTNSLAAALIMIEKSKKRTWADGRARANMDIEVLLYKYPDARRSVNFVAAKKRPGFITPSLAAAAHYLFAEKDALEADAFIGEIFYGSGLVQHDPAHALRERLIANLASKARLGQPYIMALTIKAWNYRRSGRPCKTLRYRDSGDAPEQFPVAI